MKKTYVKPEILFEDFTLSTNLAGNCEMKTETAMMGSCGITSTGVEGGFVFTGLIEGCTFDVEVVNGNDGQYDMLCYHVPVNPAAIFNS